LVLLGELLDVGDELLFLALEGGALAVQLADGSGGGGGGLAAGHRNTGREFFMVLLLVLLPPQLTL